MNNIKIIKDLLLRLTALLRGAGQLEWADRMALYGAQLDSDPEGTVAQVRRLYGGMGSLNDIVLYKDNRPLVRENTELDALRTELYDACH